MPKKNQPTKDDIIEELLKGGKSYKYIQFEIKVGSSIISSQLTNIKSAIESAKMEKTSKKKTPDIIQPVRDVFFVIQK